MLRKCFEGVQRDGDLIRVRDTVLLKSGPRKKSLPYVAKISALWEEPESGRRPTGPGVHCQREQDGCGGTWSTEVNCVFCVYLQES